VAFSGEMKESVKVARSIGQSATFMARVYPPRVSATSRHNGTKGSTSVRPISAEVIKSQGYKAG